MLHVREAGRPLEHTLTPEVSVPEGFFREAAEYEFLLRVQDDPWAYELICNDVTLPHLARRDGHFFPWRVGFYSGEVHLSLVRDGTVVWQADLVVDPDLAKLTREQYAAMLREIVEDTRSLFQLANVKIGVGASSVGKRLDLATIELLRLNLDRIERALRRVVSQPARVLRSEVSNASVAALRRFTMRDLLRTVGTGQLRTASDEERSYAPVLVSSLKGHWPHRFRTERRIESFDTRENRLILQFLIWVERLLVDALSTLDAEAGDASERLLVLSWKARLQRLKRRVSVLRGLPFLQGVKRDYLPFQTTQVFGYHPAYSAAFKGIQAVRAGLGEIGGSVVRMPVERTYKLYEIWCYLRLVRAIAVEHPEYGLDLKELFREEARGGGLGVRLAVGDTVAIKLGDRLRLVYQRTYSPEAYVHGRVGGMTGTFVPDLAFEAVAETDQGAVNAVLIVDPKYRTGGALYDAITALHTYRDAIVGPTGRVVVAAVILSPHRLTLGGTDWRSAPMPDRLFFKSFRDEHKLGAVSLRPGIAFEEVRVLARDLLAWLND